jgi:hypothetical protein
MYKVTGSSEPGDSDPSVVTVQFNPTTLSYSVQNTLKQPEKNPKAAQYVSQSSAKLEFDLIFDSTHDGHDVRAETSKIKEFLNAGEHAKPEEAAPPVIGFRWGAFKFKGFVESFRESLDFFSTDGVPLRSSVKLSLSAQNAKDIFTGEAFDKKTAGVDPANVQLVSVPPGGTSKLGSAGGNPNAGRGIAAANGFESIRNPGASLAAVASGGVQLKGAAAFSAGASAGFGAGAGAGAGFGAGASAGAGFGAGASAGAGFGASAGFGAGAGASAGFDASAGAGASFGAGASAGAGFGGGAGAAAGFGAGASAGAGFGASASAGAGFGAGGGASAGFGGSSSAGVSASAGAFSGLGASKTPASVTLNTQAFQARATTNLVTSDFAVGGRAVATASSGLTTNVGATARIRFD